MKISIIIITTTQFQLGLQQSLKQIVELDENKISDLKLYNQSDLKHFRMLYKYMGNEDYPFVNRDSKFTHKMIQNLEGKKNQISQVSKFEQNLLGLAKDDSPQPDPPEPNPPVQPKRLCPAFLSNYVNTDGNYISNCFDNDPSSEQNKICAACSLWFKTAQLKGQYYYLEGLGYYKQLIGLIGDYSSGLFLYLVGMYLIYKKKFNRYPYRLFAMALLAQAVSNFNFVNIQFFTHPMLYKFVAFTLRLSQVKHFKFDDENQSQEPNWEMFFFRQVTYQQQYKAFLLLVAVWKFITITFQQISLAINVCIYYDTYKILSNPFTPARKRQKFYILYVFTIFTATTILLFRDFFDWTSMSLVAFIPRDDSNQVQIPIGNPINYFAVLIILQLSIIFLCFLRTICILCRAGTSQQAKKRAMRFHFYYLFILFFSEVLNIQHTFTDYWHSQYDQLLFDCDENDDCNNYKYFSALIFLRFIGIIQGILRLTDPFIFQEFKKDLTHALNKVKITFSLCFQKICCCKQKKEDVVQKHKITIQKDKVFNYQLNQSQSLEVSQQLASPINITEITRKQETKMKKGDQKSQNSEKVKRKQKPLVQETINGLLNTAMNIELVYTILLGINTYMELMIKSQQEQQAQQQDTQNDQNNQELSEIQAAQETQQETKKELLKKTADYLYISQAKNTKKIGTHANYQIKQQDQAIKIKIMDVTMYDAQKFDVDQDFSDNNDSVLGQAFNQDYRLKDSLTRDQDKFNFPQDQIILDQSFSKSFEETNLVQSNSQIGNKLQRMVTGNFGSNQKNQDKRILNETPAFHPTLKFQQTKEPIFDLLQIPQNDSFISSTKKLQQTDDDLNKISFDSEVIESPKKQMSIIRQFSGRSDFSNRKLENEKNGSFLQTMSVLGQNLKIDYGDRNQNVDRSISQSFSIQQNLANKPKKQNLISKIMQLESREQFRLKETDFVEDIIFDPVEVTMKSGHNREVSLALRFRIPEVQKKESFYLPKVISVESRTNNQKKNFQNRNLSRQGRASIQDKFFHEQNFVLEQKYTLNQKSNGLKRQFSNKSLNQVQPTKSYSQADSPLNNQILNDSKLKFSQAKSQKEKTKMSINLKTDIVCLEPQKFAKIMEMDGINPQDVIKSLSISANYKQLFKAGEGSGQSGSFFFFSWDKKLLIKTLRGQEKKNLLKMLDEMIEYFEKVNNRSLLARIYGCFTIKSNYFPDLDVIVMQNATQLIAPKLSDIITFDLKGSTKGRKTRIQKASEKFWKQKMSFKGTLKDLNLAEIMNDKGSAIIKISESQFDTLEYIIHRDSKFLRKHNLMDYSLLLTIEQVPCTKEQYDEQETQFQEKKKLKMDEIMHLKRLSGAALAQSILFNSPNDRKASSQNRKTQGQSTSIKDLLNARTIVDLREQSLHLKNFHFNTSEHRSSIVSGEINTQSNSKIKNSITSNQNNKSEYASELQSLKQEYKDNAQFRNFLKTQIIKEQVVKKEDLRKSHFIKNKLTQRDKLDKSQREDTFRYKKQQPDQKRKKTQKKMGESYRSQDEEDEVEYKYYRQVAHLAIIDYLQEWSIIKKMENALMRFTLSKQEINTISAVHPELYQSRFENFMVQQFLKPGREKFMSQEKKNYSETCDEFIMKLAYDIRMSELDKEKEQNLVKIQDDEQLQLSGEYDGQFKENQFNVSYEEIQYNLLKSKKQNVVMRQSKEFILPDSANDTPVSLRQNLELNKSEVYRAQLTFGQNQYLIDDAVSDDGQQK